MCLVFRIARFGSQIFKLSTKFCKLSDDMVTSSTEVSIYALLSEIPIPNYLYILCDNYCSSSCSAFKHEPKCFADHFIERGYITDLQEI